MLHIAMLAKKGHPYLLLPLKEGGFILMTAYENMFTVTVAFLLVG